jgi:hypothetical protein
LHFGFTMSVLNGTRNTMSKWRVITLSLLFLFVGIMIGGYLFSQSQPRSLLALNQCQNCLRPNDLAGLLASVGIQKLPGMVPFTVFETDKTIAIKLPLQKQHFHYVIIPKKDIKNIGELSETDDPYLIDAHLVARQIIEKDKLYKYRFYTNGPGFQNVTYLHFHLTDR